MLYRTDKFKKAYNKLSRRLREKVVTRLDIFLHNEFEEVLNNHPLHGEYSSCRSINVTGDIRIVYKKIENGDYILINIGTHSHLYE